MVASTERWRSLLRRSPSVAPARSSASSSVGVRVSVRAAASSMASGSPPSSRTISATAAVVAGHVDAGTHGRGTVVEQLDRRPVVGHAERVDRHDVLAGNAEAVPARRQHDSVGGPGQDQLDQLGGGIEHVLAVVQHQQRRRPAQVLDDPGRQVTAGAIVEAERRRHRPDHRLRASDRRQLAEHDTSGEAIGDGRRRVQRQPGLADSTRSGERDEPGPAEQLDGRASSSARPTNELPGTPMAGVLSWVSNSRSTARSDGDGSTPRSSTIRVAELGEHVQAVDVAPEPRQRTHLQGDRTLAVRLVQRQRRRRVLRLGVAAGAQQQLDPALGGIGAQPLQTLGGRAQLVDRRRGRRMPGRATRRARRRRQRACRRP